MRNVPVLDYSDAKKIVDLIVDKARQMEKAVVVAVADPHGELIAFARMDGAPISPTKLGRPLVIGRQPKKLERKSAILKGDTTSLTTAILDSSAGAGAFLSGKRARSPEPSRSAAYRRKRILSWLRLRLISSARRKHRNTRFIIKRTGQ